MEFDSPDVEKDFPGLYSSEAIRRNNESDFSDDSHEKSFKADLIGKKKDKKDRGYAALEGESSPDEGDAKSPSKNRKTKAFKFPVKKSEKREKSRDKEAKEKELEKDKKKDKEKKEKIKQKERKKGKEESLDCATEDHGVFGAPLALAVERLGCLDGVGIPLPVRHCIDCIQASGLSMEGLYKTDKTATMKTKLQTLKKNYNAREPVIAADMDVHLAAQLLITYLKELPEPILTSEFLTRFEEAGAVLDVAKREEDLLKLLKQLPLCNRTLLAWLILHFDYVTQHEKQNKINAQSIAMTFSPVLQMSHRLLTALLCHCKSLFSDTTIHKYVPPLAPGSSFPETVPQLAIELAKQEALLAQMHRDMSEGLISKKREEQLWEVQRVVTQLKRKLRSLQKTHEASQMQRSLDEEHAEEIWKKREDVKEEPTLEKPFSKPAESPSVKPTESANKLEPISVKQEARKGSISDASSTSSSKSKASTEVEVFKEKPENVGSKSKNEVAPVTKVEAKIELSHRKSDVAIESGAPVGGEVTSELPKSSSPPPIAKNEVKKHQPDHPHTQTKEKLEHTKRPQAEIKAEHSLGPPQSPPIPTGITPESWEKAKLQFEHTELLLLHDKLKERIEHERRLAERFRSLIEPYKGFSNSDSEDSSAESTPGNMSPKSEARLRQLHLHLLQKKDALSRRIMEEREACMKLKVYIHCLSNEQASKAS